MKVFYIMYYFMMLTYINLKEKTFYTSCVSKRTKLYT